MPELLFEIGCEELPALAIEPAMSFMESFIREGLKDAQLNYTNIKALGTPRRLVLTVENIDAEQEDVTEEILGPSIAVAYDNDGSLSRAGLGFLKSKGLSEADIYRKQTKKGEVIAGKKLVKGVCAREILPDLLLEMMRKIPFKKRMRWEESNEPFARPVRWILSLFGSERLAFSFAGVDAGTYSRGHRFMSPKTFAVESIEHYLSQLRKRFVVLCPKEREQMFEKLAEKKLATLGATFRPDRELMATVRNLFEYPFAILGKFEEKYLAIPQEILVCEMKNHQKCFSVHDDSGQMLPWFICSAASKAHDEEFFAKGNARVLRARFEDGAFYFAEDRKKSLREHAKGLSKLIFERDLGTVAEKCQRIEEVALAIATEMAIDDEQRATIKKAAAILKADLITGVVGEFPELQGVIGSRYAALDGEGSNIAEILEGHYWPRFSDDALPRSTVSAIFSVADRLDTLVGIIAIGKKPSGNKDPFALRRAAIAMVRIFIEFGINLDLDQLISWSIDSYGDKFVARRSAILSDCHEFIIQRARGLLIEDLSRDNEVHAVNIADSVLSVSAQNILDAFARAHTLAAMQQRDQDEFASLVQAFKRASNIVKKAADEKMSESDLSFVEHLSSPVELELRAAVTETKKAIDHSGRVNGLVGLKSNYAEIFSHVAKLKPKLDAFFDKVMVMVDDRQLRRARLALLNQIKGVADKIADFTHL